MLSKTSLLGILCITLSILAIPKANAQIFFERKINIDFTDFFDKEGNTLKSLELEKRRRRYKITLENVPENIKFIRLEGKKRKRKVKFNKATFRFKTGKQPMSKFLALETFIKKKSDPIVYFAQLNILNKDQCPDISQDTCAFIFYGNEPRIEAKIKQKTFQNSCLANKSNASLMYNRTCDGKDYVTNFIKNNPNRSSMHLIENDQNRISFNSSRVQPLASAMKTIIAIEYAKQVSSGKINPNEPIDLKDLAIFFVEGTDGGSHQAWLNDMQEKGLIINDKIALEEVSKGMISFSSNANTEYLMQKLGLDLINKNLDSLKLDKHDPLWENVSYLFTVFKKPPNISVEEHIANLKELSRKDFALRSNEIHPTLKNDIDGSFKATIDRDLIANFDVSKIFSANFTSATAQEYAEVMQKINSRTFFDAKTQENLDKVMEGIFNPNLFKHLGGKGGSTAFILTNANYVTDSKGTKLEFAVFFQDLEIEENVRLQENWAFFFLSLILDSNFRAEVINSLPK